MRFRYCARFMALVLVAVPLLAWFAMPRAANVRAADGPVHLVKDINPITTSGAKVFNPIELTPLGNTLFFAGEDAVNGRQLWKSDGTLAGTQALTSINFGGTTRFITNLTAVGDTLFFVTLTEEPRIYELWKSDGTPSGTVRIITSQQANNLQLLDQLTAVGNTLFFVAYDSVAGNQLWKSDGTPAGTVRIADIQPTNNNGLPPDHFTAAGNLLYFTVDNGPHERALWKSDGTSAGTVLVSTVEPRSALATIGTTVFFAAFDTTYGMELWKSDGTSAGTMLVRDIWPGVEDSYPTGMTVVGTQLFFAANDGVHGIELWKSNGTATGTTLIKDIKTSGDEGQSGPFSAYPRSITAVGTGIFFTTGDSMFGSTLWKSDGSAAGTVQVKQFEYRGDTDVVGLTPIGTNLFFLARLGYPNNNYTLWKTDGTAVGTVQLSTVPAGRARTDSSSSAAGEIVALGTRLFFIANPRASVLDLWTSTGTPSGTLAVAPINIPSDSTPFPIKLGNNTLFFGADDGTHGRELWRSDGTANNTTLVKDVNPPPPADSSNVATSWGPCCGTMLGNTLIFVENSQQGNDVWRSDGTPSGTFRLTDLHTDANYYGPRDFAVLNNKVYFSTYTRDEVALWATDGTVEHTQRVLNFDTEDEINNLTQWNNTLFFHDNNNKLWKSDGTAAGTQQVIELQNSDGGINELIPSSVGLFFITYQTINYDTVTYKLWKTNGTSAGTQLLATYNVDYLSIGLRSFTTLGNALYFTVANKGKTALWKSDGSVAGTTSVSTLALTNNTLTVAGTTLFFAADDGVSGVELWKSDGTTAGTTQVKDINPGRDDSRPAALANINGTLLFSAYEPAHGNELWQSDGSAAGTVLVQDINPGFGNSNPQGLIRVGDQVVFQAYTPDVGTELWALPVSALVAPAPVTATPTAPAPPSTTPTTPASGTTTPPSSTPTTTPTPLTFTGNIRAATGGTVSTPDGSLTLSFPPGAVAEDVVVTFTVPVPTLHPLPAGQAVVHSFALHAVNGAGVPVTQFALPYTLTIDYTAAQISAVHVRESTLSLVYWNGSAWVSILPCAGCSLNTDAHTLTVRLDHFTDFAVIGGTSAVYLPLTTR